MALVLAGAGYWIAHEYQGNHLRPPSVGDQALILPRRALTPGAVLPVRVDELCQTPEVDNDPPVQPALQAAVFTEYGLPDSSRIAYELDYLITPALGGSDDIRNLWPQPYSSTWNARVKDQLEDHLHQLVCQGKVQLTTAQNEIATNWISAYKTYFHSEEPMIAMGASEAGGPGKLRVHAALRSLQRVGFANVLRKDSRSHPSRRARLGG